MAGGFCFVGSGTEGIFTEWLLAMFPESEYGDGPKLYRSFGCLGYNAIWMIVDEMYDSP